MAKPQTSSFKGLIVICTEFSDRRSPCQWFGWARDEGESLDQLLWHWQAHLWACRSYLN